MSTTTPAADAVAAFRAAVEAGDVEAALARFGDDGHVLEFTARVDDLALHGIDILRPGPDGLRRLTVMVRPYSAATAQRERMAALLSG